MGVSSFVKGFIRMRIAEKHLFPSDSPFDAFSGFWDIHLAPFQLSLYFYDVEEV
ncbi:MAG: hypothetical protein NVSMB70_16900 [Chamaesiphon sp.]